MYPDLGKPANELSFWISFARGRDTWMLMRYTVGPVRYSRDSVYLPFTETCRH